MNQKLTDNLLKKFPNYELIAFICASAALRKYNILKLLLAEAKQRKIKRMQIYESLLQNYLFTGYPNALNALKIFAQIYPAKKTDTYEDWDLIKYRERGIKNCRKIYGDKFEKLISNIKEFSPDLSDWLVLEGYGKVLGRKNLSLKQRELNIISVLSVQKFEPQLFSHINGAFRLNAGKKQVESVIENLVYLGNSYRKFGLKVLKNYLQK